MNRRLFFAIDLKDAANAASREEIIALKHVMGKHGCTIPDDNLHITLAFLGNVDATQYDACCQAADAIQLPSFTIHTTKTGFFTKPQILWLGIAQSPSLARLVTPIQAIRRTVLGQSDTHSYLPHISLLRKAQPLKDDVDLRTSLQVKYFGLYASEPSPTGRGVQYICLNRWALTGASPLER
ncbi:RNA 2',3'-cyclic phosphodiesterase [Enterovibrio sp. ZSDZ35]|uniref:RNA 2',3'-cyclic phosphodiesterase n=1 Tax=Enterovibrio qingdaonensis TaxID=2899818 RepID=A0ABT5QP85_9GAMM|nr:RNA 2',3'-cyclic phosphodiesterase [Enterovibrio sp. ZSDZ35]MDD1782310.1 RNA 2',3'-cyclic phosphodiesterase [Enterovibrio sp. ZSDZ35]